MTQSTMTGWIEIADERHFLEATVPEQAPRDSGTRHSPAILRLPCRIISALSGHHAYGSRH
jgi:hypothetical protein